MPSMIDHPIAALATPPGRSALGVVRLTGTGAFAIAERVVSAFVPHPRQATLAVFRDAHGVPIDQGLYTVFPGPGSYTGEDMVEFSCHGGLLVPAQLLAALHAAGARPARPGEFTLRAVLHGKMDLVQAEAVGDLIDATAERQGRVALDQLEGGLSRRLDTLRTRLLDVLALLAYDVDFPDEDDGPIPLERIVAALDAISVDLTLLLATAPAGERLREGAVVVFAGRPNAGKSSLFNALLGTNRALVTEIPGTTRDAVEASTEIDGWPVRLIDTAGLWDATNALDRLGVDVSRRYLGTADLVLLCVEAGRDLEGEEAEIQQDPRALLVRTKSDLSDATGVSVVTGEGLDPLRRTIAARLFDDGEVPAEVEPWLTRARHRTALASAESDLHLARPHLIAEGDAVLAAHHVRLAVTALEELVGAIDPEDVLTRLFSRFCVGK